MKPDTIGRFNGVGVAFRLITPVMTTMATILGTVCIFMLSNIQRQVEILSLRVEAHLNDPSLHHAAVSKFSEGMKSIERRVDVLEDAERVNRWRQPDGKI